MFLPSTSQMTFASVTASKAPTSPETRTPKTAKARSASRGGSPGRCCCREAGADTEAEGGEALPGLPGLPETPHHS